MTSVKQRFAYFKTSVKEKWSKAHREEAVYFKTNENWLSGTFELSTNVGNRLRRQSKSFNL